MYEDKKPKQTLKKLCKQASLFLVLFIVTLIVFFPFESINARLEDELEYRARQQGILLDIEKLSLSFPLDAEANSVSAIIPIRKAPLPLRSTEVKLSSHPWSLLLLQAAMSASAKLYQGEMSAEVVKSLFGSTTNAKLQLASIELGDHPALKDFQLQGTLSLSAETVISRGSQESALDLHIAEGSYAGEIKISIIKIPKFQNLQLTLKANQRGENIIIDRMQLECSLGDAYLTGTMQLQNNRLSAANLSARIELTSEGVKDIGGYLALAAQQNVERPASRWTVSISKKPSDREPKVSIREAK